MHNDIRNITATLLTKRALNVHFKPHELHLKCQNVALRFKKRFMPLTYVSMFLSELTFALNTSTVVSFIYPRSKHAVLHLIYFNLFNPSFNYFIQEECFIPRSTRNL